MRRHDDPDASHIPDEECEAYCGAEIGLLMANGIEVDDDTCGICFNLWAQRESRGYVNRSQSEEP